MKHIELRKLVAQEWQKEGRIAFLKIPTEENEADLLTKWVDIRTLTYLLGKAGVKGWGVMSDNTRPENVDLWAVTRRSCATERAC